MRALIIEDDNEISAFIEKGLKAESFTVDQKVNGEEGLIAAKTNEYDVVILDFYLPDLTGLEIAKEMRKKKKNTPIIVLTGESQIDKKIKMLEYCDDYITKPFSVCELIARIRAVLRRGDIIQGDVLQAGDLIMDIKAHKVTRSEKEINLRNKEFALLEYFMRNPGMVLSRSAIFEKVWDISSDPFTNTIDVHVRLLRKKINTGYSKNLIRTIPTRGYKLEI